MDKENLIKVLKILFLNKIYTPLFLILAYLFSYFLYQLSNPFSIIAMNSYTYAFFNLGLAVLIGIFFAINIILLIYKFNLAKKLNGGVLGTSSFAAIAGAFGAGCPVCGATLLSYLGVAGGLSILPFAGMELKTLGFTLLVFSTYKVSKDIDKVKGCSVNLKKTTKKNKMSINSSKNKK